MRYCPACGHENPDDVATCLNCAQSLGQSCPACGHWMPAGTQFCGHCGARLPEGSSSPTDSLWQDRALHNLRTMMPTTLVEKINAASIQALSERREVTVLFLDVANFTAAAHRMDGEDTFVLIDKVMRLLVQVIYKYEGTIDKFTGDGLMALFGAPLAHENDPERAVRAALEMQTDLQPLRNRVKQEHGFDLRVRIGINTGLVVAGKVGSDLHMEYTVIGDTVNLAAHLETAAEPGTILVTQTTYERTRPLLRYEALPPLTVKGLAQPIVVYRPVALQEKPGQIRGLPGLEAPMVGRADALAQLAGALAEVRQRRHSRLVLVTGEAGLGKSRLIAEFRKSLAESQVSVCQGTGLAYARSTPLWLVANLLRDMLQLAETDPASVQQEKLQARLSQLGCANDQVLPYLTHLLRLEQADSEATARLRLLDASMLQQQTHAALRQVLLAPARLAPTILIFEDLHWVDSASSAFLEYFTRLLCFGISGPNVIPLATSCTPG